MTIPLFASTTHRLLSKPATLSLSIPLLFLLLLLPPTPTCSAQHTQQPPFLPAVRHHHDDDGKPVKIPLSGGLLHVSAFYLTAKVGGQQLTLMVSTSYSSLIVPRKGCVGCRIGDRRYDPAASKGDLVACHDPRCGGTPDKCDEKKCFNCARSGNCCVEKSDQCAFNMFYGDGTSGNGTLVEDTLHIDHLSARLLFGTMHSESHNFELPYADGVIGLAFQKGACHPNCIPPVMDAISNQTGIENVATMCVTRFGGTLVLGRADPDLAQKDYQYIDVLDTAVDNRFITPALSYWRVADKKINVPGITAAMWSTGTTNIGISKTTFLAFLEHLMENFCHVPGLCSMTSWFRPQHCSEISDEAVKAMPDITIGLTEEVKITLTPEDYIIKYRVIGGKQHRCVAFIATDSLAEKGIGLLLGTTVMRKYAVVFDREKKRVGLAPAKEGECGPTTGTDEGLPGSADKRKGSDDVLTADSPEVKEKPDSGSALQEQLITAETCRAETTCSGCSKLSNCSFGYQNGRCVPSEEATGQPYPYCSGALCACFAVGTSGWYVGVFAGLVIGVALVSVGILIHRKRKRRNAYTMVQPYEEQDLETF